MMDDRTDRRTDSTIPYYVRLFSKRAYKNGTYCVQVLVFFPPYISPTVVRFIVFELLWSMDEALSDALMQIYSKRELLSSLLCSGFHFTYLFESKQLC